MDGKQPSIRLDEKFSFQRDGQFQAFAVPDDKTLQSSWEHNLDAFDFWNETFPVICRYRDGVGLNALLVKQPWLASISEPTERALASEQFNVDPIYNIEH